MNKKLIGQVGASAILLSTIFGVAPASAEGVVLPSNANGVDNSGIQAVLCENALQMRLPITQAPSPVVENQALYFSSRWVARIGEQTIDDVNPAGSYIGSDHSLGGTLAEPITTETATITLEYYDYDYNSATFDIELTVSDTEFAGGDGSYANPFQVSTVDQLSQMRCERHKYFELINDIDLEGVDWMPLGLGSYDYGVWSGSFDGNGHTISNLEVDGPYNSSGLFGRVTNSQIRDLTLKDFKISGYRNVGALVGETRASSFSNITIENGDVTGNIHVGLVAGTSQYRSAFTNIKVTGSSTGVVGLMFDGSENSVGYDAVNYIAGVVGYEDGDGSMWHDVTADVDVAVTGVSGALPNVEYNFINSYASVEQVGGFSGRTGELSSFTNVNLKADITLLNDPIHPSNAYQVGGVFGKSEESYAHNFVADVTLQDLGEGKYDNIGGFVGETEAFVASNIDITSDIKLEAGTSEQGGESYDIGGFVGDSGYDSGAHDIKSVSKVEVVRVGDTEVRNIGGFAGYDDDVLYQRIDSTATVVVSDGNGSNNSLNVNLEAPSLAKKNIGGFIGERDDYTTYREVSSNADVTVNGTSTSRVGGFIGIYDDGEGASFKNVISRGTVTVPAGSSDIAAFVGRASWMRLTNVLISTDLNVNGSTESVGHLVGSYSRDSDSFESGLRVSNSFTNSGLGNPTDMVGVPNMGVAEASMKSSTFLKEHDFDLVKIFKHVEGQWPTVRLEKLSTEEPTTVVVPASIKKGRTNADTSISVGALKKNGVRSYFVNLPNSSAGKTAALFVIRKGKKVALVHKATLNRVGNWSVTSKIKLVAGDVLRVEIGGKNLRTLSL